MKIVTISDTHRKHDKVEVPEGDLLIFAGDGDFRSPSSTNPFLDWFEAQPHTHKIMIAGNHDFVFEHSTEENYNKYMRGIVSRDIIYLENSGIEINGFNIWGSPYTPLFGAWAFMKKRGMEIAGVWNKIPNNTDILITHGPPMYNMDICRGVPVGCLDLLEKVNDIKPKLHIFGHIHDGYGIKQVNNTIFVNCSICNEQYQPVNNPIVIDL